MTWPLVGLVAVVLGAVVAGYVAWAFFDVRRAQGQRDSLRLEMESAAVKGFDARITAAVSEVDKLRGRVNMMASEGKLR